MKENRFLDGVSNIDLDIVERFIAVDNRLQDKADRPINKKKTKGIWLRLGAAAACLAVIIGAVITFPMLNGGVEYNSDADYKIKSENGNDYIVFDNPSKYAVSSGLNAQIRATVSFKSLKDFKDTVTKGNLTEGQKAQIATVFLKDEKGNILTCDFDKLYAPTLPKDVSMGIVEWRGETYSFSFNTTGSVFGNLHYLTPSSYKELFNYEYETFFDRDLINVTETKDLGDGKTATYYTTSAGRFMRIRYTLSEGNKTYVIDKSYTLEWYSHADKVSYTVPYSINMYCSDAKTYYRVDMFEFTEDPTDEWLMQFGLTPYVETDAVVK